MAAVADHKGFALGAHAVQVDMQSRAGPDEGTCFRSTIQLDSGLDPRQRRMLFNAARTCEVHKLLRHPLTFEEELHSTP